MILREGRSVARSVWVLIPTLVSRLQETQVMPCRREPVVARTMTNPFAYMSNA